MKNNYVNKMIHKNNAIFLTLILIATLSVAYFLKPVYNNIYNYICGPFDMTPEALFSINDLSHELVSIENPLRNDYYINDNKFYYRITGYEPIKTEAKEVVYRSDNDTRVIKSKYEYLLLKIEDKYLIIRARMNSSATKFSGVFLPLIPKIKYDIKLYADVLSSEEELIPFVFDATGNLEKRLRSQLLITVSFFAILVFLYYIIIRRIINPKYHPLYKKLSIYGAPEKIAESISREVMDAYTYEDGKYLRIYNWNIKRSLFRPDITSNHRTN